MPTISAGGRVFTADLVVIDDDPFACGLSALLSARVCRTVVGGRPVHLA